MAAEVVSVFKHFQGSVLFICECVSRWKPEVSRLRSGGVSRRGEIPGKREEVNLNEKESPR